MTQIHKSKIVGKIGKKIGVFDSGFGGLSILKEIVKMMPKREYLYFGDSARAPYGVHSHDVIYKYTKECLSFMFKNGCEIVILACNSASSGALRKIQQDFLPNNYPNKKVLGVIIPTVEEVMKLNAKKVGVLGTEATVSSKTFVLEIGKLDKKVKVSQVACPLLVPIIENGEEKKDYVVPIIKNYLRPLIRQKIDTLILGCTHYNFVESQIKKVLKNVMVISEGKIVGKKLKEYLFKHKNISDKLSLKEKIEFFTTDDNLVFDRHGSRFFGKKINSKKVNLSNEK